MSNALFGIDIAKLIDDNISDGLLPVTLTRTIPGTRVDSTSGTQPTTTSLSGKGVVTSYKNSEIDGTVIKRGDRKVLLITNSFTSDPNPQSGDLLTIETITGGTIMNEVSRDPAGATYTCQVRSF